MAGQGYSNITQVVENYIGGVSQQPHIKRSANQFEVCENFYPDPLKGLVRRPPTTFLMEGAERYNGYNTIYDPGDGHKYIVNIDGINIKIIHIGTGTEVYSDTLSGYLTGATKDDIHVVPYMDTLFVLNRKVTPEMPSHHFSGWNGSLVYTKTAGVTAQLFIQIKGGHYGRTYKVISGSGAVLSSFTTPKGTVPEAAEYIQPAVIAQCLAAPQSISWEDGKDSCSGTGNLHTVGSNATPPFTVYIQDNFITFYFSDTTNYDASSIYAQVLSNSIRVDDGAGGQDIVCFTNIHPIQDISCLPVRPKSPFSGSFIVSSGSKIANNYYISYSSTDNGYVETKGRELIVKINYNTMPFKITRNSWNSFTLSPIYWYDREVGDNDSNPPPSFIGQPIKDMCIYNSRLCLMTGSSICMSRSNLIEDFWFSSATDITDDDPIDLNVLSDSTALLERMVILDGNLFLLSKDAQYVLRHEGTMTSKNTSVALISQYEMKMCPKPIEGEKKIFYLTEDSGYTGVNAYFSAGTVNEAYDSTNLSQRVRKLIPSGSKAFCYIKNDNQLYVLGPDGKTIYGYRWLYDGDNLVMSSWYTWKMGTSFSDMLVNGHDIYLLGETACEKISLDVDYDFETEAGASDYRLYIDSKGEYIIPDSYKFPYVNTYPIDSRYAGEVLDAYYLITASGLQDIFDLDLHIREGYCMICGYHYFDHTSDVILTASDWITVETHYSQSPPPSNGRYLKIPRDLYYGVCTKVPSDEYSWMPGMPDLRYLPPIVYGTKRYVSRLVSSPLYKKGFTQSGALYTQTDGRTVLDGYDLQYEGSGLITAKITRTDTGQTDIYNKVARVLSDPQLTVGKTPVDSGNFHIPIRGDTSRLQLEISTESVYPCNLVQGEWKGRLYKHGRRI